MRILALDVGEKRVGLAVSDPMGWTAQSLGVLAINGKKSLFAGLSKYIESFTITHILIGLPRHMNGELGPEGEKIKTLGEEIRRIFNLPVEFWDERLTTAEASRVLLEADLSRRRRREVIDQTAATIMLSSYLRFLNNKKE